MAIPTLDDYLSAGHQKAGNWTELARKLKVNQYAVRHWRQGKGYPCEKTMWRLARYVHMDEQTALLHLNYWKAKGRAKKLYQQMIEGRLGA